MNRKILAPGTLLTLALGLVGLVAQPALAADAPEFKQLAGPPEEFTQMAAPDSTATANHSKSALIPVKITGESGKQWAWQAEIPFEKGPSRVVLILPGGEGESAAKTMAQWSVRIDLPATKLKPKKSLAPTSVETSTMGIGTTKAPAM